MNDLVEEFLKIKTYEEFDKRREEFRKLPRNDPRVREHFGQIFPVINDGVKDGILIDVFKTKPR